MTKIKNTQINLFNKNDIGYDIIWSTTANNCVGFGQGIDLNYDYLHPRVFQYPASGNYLNKIIQAREPLQHINPNERPNAIGALLTLGRCFADILPTNRKILIVPCALQATGFAESRWNPGDDLFNLMVVRINEIISAYPNSKPLAMVYSPHDAEKFYSSAEFKTRLDNFLTSIRTSITGASTMPYILFRSTQQAINTDSDRARMNNDLAETPTRLSRCSLIETSDLLSNDETLGDGDTLHFSAQAQRIIGQRCFDKYLELYY